LAIEISLEIAACDSNSRLGGDEVDIRGLRMEINY